MDKKIVTLDEFIGQPNAIETIKVIIDASKKRNEIPEHFLLIGSEGSGKHTLANAIAHELSSDIKIFEMKEFKRPGDFSGVFTTLSEGDVVLIEDVDEIKEDMVELFCDAMENQKLEVKIGKGPSCRVVSLPLQKFTLIGIAEKKAGIPKKLSQCFYADVKLTEYSVEELFLLAKRWCAYNGTEITDDAAEKIAVYAEGSNKILNRAMKRARDFATVYNDNVISVDIIDKTISNLSDKELV